MKMPELTFACELESAELQALFSDQSIIDELLALQAGVSLGLLDLSPERVAVVRQLNTAGIPITAWLLLPKEEGYWFNIDNAPQAAARYAAFKAWTDEHDLQWAGVGIDIEPDFNEIQQILRGEGGQLASLVLRRIRDSGRALDGRLAYGALVREMRADGYQVTSYQLPFIVDERKVDSTLLQRALGIVDVPADRETLMLYTSFVRPVGPGFLNSYGADADVIGVGSTGGGVEIDGLAALSWEEFSRDLRIAYRWSDDIFIFSLEGCAEQGFLARLRDFDWEQTLAMPTAQIEQVNRARAILRGALWASSHPFTILAGLISLLFVMRALRRLRQ